MHRRLFWPLRLAFAGMLLAAFPCSTLLAQDPGRAELLQLNQALFESMLVHQDSTLFASVALDEVIVIPPGGIVENREQVIAGLKNFRITAVSLDDVQTIAHGSTAIVAGRLTPAGELRGAGSLGPMRFLSVFVNSDGAWRLLARSLTPCAERAISAGRC